MPVRVARRTPVPAPILEAVRGAPEVPFQAQIRPKWCWSACAAMVLDALGRPKTQCAIASEHLGVAGGCCELDVQPCTGIGVTPCDRTRKPEHIAVLWDENEVPAALIDRALLEDELLAALQAGQMVQVWWEGINDVFDHVVLIVGEAPPAGGVRMYQVANPCDTGISTASHEQIRRNRGGWERTWILGEEHG